MNRTLLFAAVLSAGSLFSTNHAAAASFTYHGNLQDAGKPAEGKYDIELTLYTAPTGGSIIGGPLTVYAVAVHEGTFSTEADFGALAKSFSQAYVGVKVRAAGKGDFAALDVRSGATPDTNTSCPGSWSLDGNAGNPAGSYLGTADSNHFLMLKTEGAQVASAFVNGAAVPSWIGGGVQNFSLNANGSFIGGGGSSTSAASANGVGPLSVVGGGEGNQAGASAASHAFVGGGQTNKATATWASVSGGLSNTASGGESTICGGVSNTATMSGSTVGGGGSNAATGQYATVGGGGGSSGTSGNHASGIGSTVAGGHSNASGGDYSFSAGQSNSATGISSVAIGEGNLASKNYAVALGIGNIANGEGSVALGESANAAHDFSFVFSDGGSAQTSAPDQFIVSATGGVGINTSNGPIGTESLNGYELTLRSSAGDNGNTDLALLSQASSSAAYRGFSMASEPNGFFSLAGLYNQSGTLNFDPLIYISHIHAAGGGSNSAIAFNRSGLSNGVFQIGNSTLNGNGAYLTAGGVWTNGSSRTFKDEFASVDATSVLDKVVSMSVQTWFYKGDHGEGRHMGPVAEEFAATFGLGNDETHIGTVDESGVAFAAIKGLNQKVETENAQLKTQNVALQGKLDEVLARLAKLETAKGN